MVNDRFGLLAGWVLLLIDRLWNAPNEADEGCSGDWLVARCPSGGECGGDIGEYIMFGLIFSGE